MKQAIRKQWKNFVAILGLILVAALVAGYVLAHQRLNLPGWVPIFGRDHYTLKAEFSTAQAVTPGQGQTVDIAGVQVGEIQKVELKAGQALVTMDIKPKYSAIYPDATMLLRPKTGLKDMVVEMDPGSPTSGDRLPSGSTLPISNTAPDVNLDEVLSSLDGDTRAYLQLLLQGAGEGLHGNGENLAAAFRRFAPTGREVVRITKLLAARRQNIAHVQHNFQILATAIARKDRQLAQLVDGSNAFFRALARQDVNLRLTLRELPPTLSVTRTALVKTDQLARVIGPTLNALLPGARALGPSLAAQRPFLRITTPIIRDQLRPFTVAALPTVRLLRPAAQDLAALTPDLNTATDVVNYILNELAFNPKGSAEEGYLFWASWANHDGNAVFSNQDAHGPIRRGIVLASCSTLGILSTLANPALNQGLSLLTQLLNAPPVSQVCPTPSGTSG